MSKREKLLRKILDGSGDANIPFGELRGLLRYFGFTERIRGSHHIYTRDDVIEILNLQPLHSMAKAYQVKQIRHVIVKYRIGVKKNG